MPDRPLPSRSRLPSPFAQAPVRPDWLAQVAEPPLSPGVPILDAHMHLWDWAPDQRYLFDEVMADLDSHPAVRATLHVDARAMVRQDGDPLLRVTGETEFAAGVAAMTESGAYGPVRLCSGMVVAADLRLGADLRRLLDAQDRAAGGRLRGVRMSAAYNPDNPRGRPQHLLRDPDVRAGLALLAPRDLSFDAYVFHDQLDDVVDLARAFPDTAIVLNHTGAPRLDGKTVDERAAGFDLWRRGMERLAACRNVTVKLGGLGMASAGFGFHRAPLPPTSEQLAAAWGPWVHTTLGLFGPDRVMAESNFPVDKASCSYVALWNAFARLTQHLPLRDRQAIFAGTAMRVYRVGLPASL